MSGLNGAYSSTSTSPTTNRTFESFAAAARRRASSICFASRSTPTTARQRGASASATRPAPVPASSRVSSASGSALRRSRKTGLSSSGRSAGRVSARDGAIGRARDEARVLRQGAPGIARLRSLHALETLLQLGGGQLDVELALFDVDHDGVTVAKRRDRAAFGSLGRDVADHESVGRSGEAPVGHERNGVAEAGPLERARHVEHLAHAWPAPGTLPADDDHVVGLDLPSLHGLERVLFAVEHLGGAAVEIPLLSRDLGDPPLRREITPEDDDAPLGPERIRERAEDPLALRLARGARPVAGRP